jgi:mono/diheme cytochrome c family protein
LQVSAVITTRPRGMSSPRPAVAKRKMGRRRMRQIAYSWFLCVGALSSHPIAALAADSSQSHPSRVQKGADLYAQRCEGCHGEKLRNTSGGWSFDLRRLRPDEHDRFVESVTSGKDNMPSGYGVLRDDEIEAIWSYIRAMVDK